MDNVKENSTTSTLPKMSVRPCGLMDLAVETRIEIIRHLLPNAQEIEASEGWGAPVYRRQDEPCHTAILCANHQLYAEGTAVMYNRAFRVRMEREGCSFLNGRYYLSKETLEPSWGKFPRKPKPNNLSIFPFHMVKQIQIELWAPDVRFHFIDLRSTLISFCSILYGQPGIKNVRVDFYDESYKPVDIWSYEGLFDDDEARPDLNKHQGKMDILEVRRPYIAWTTPSELWERRIHIEESRHELCCNITDFELILQPLKQLRNIGKAQINLTPTLEKDEGVKRTVRECQDAMMSSGPQDEFELGFMNWCSDPLFPWNLENL